MRNNILTKDLMCNFIISIILIVNLVLLTNIANYINKTDKYEESLEDFSSNIKISSHNFPNRNYYYISIR